MTASDYAWWERHGPSLPSHGIKARTRRGAFGKSWWASRWIDALEQLVNPGRLARGRTYARTGRVVSLDVDPDGVRAIVNGSRPQPYQVSIQFKRLSNAEWQRVIDAMAAEALYAARLLSGEMPEEIEELFSSSEVGCSLFPAHAGDLVADCSCPDPANPCKHIAAVHYLLGERFDEDPFVMFLLRGRSREEIIAELRARRGGPEQEAGPEVEQAAEVDVSSFWSAPPQTEEVALHFALPESDALAVKRLGPPPFVRDQAAYTAAMERLYRQIGEYALLLALDDGDSELA
ncbi:MAG: SWIM zinc finger family protein [Chloroflexota bacterium]